MTEWVRSYLLCNSGWTLIASTPPFPVAISPPRRIGFMKLPFEILNPAGLWMLTALVPLVVLYILKIKRQRLRVPSTWLWAAAQRDLLAKSPVQASDPADPALPAATRDHPARPRLVTPRLPLRCHRR